MSSVCHCQFMALTVYYLKLEEILVRVVSVSLSVYGPYGHGLKLQKILVRAISVSLLVSGLYGIILCSET